MNQWNKILDKTKSKSHYDWRSVSQSVSLGVEPHLGHMPGYLLLFDSYGLVYVQRPLWREDGSVFYISCWALTAQSFSGPSPMGLATVFYFLRLETSLFVASYASQGHGGGIRPRLHTGYSYVTAFTSLISTLHRPHGKHRLYCYWRHRLRGSVFTETLLRNGLHNPVVPLLLGADDIGNTTSSIVA
jgi:hypothetical protein